MRPTGTPRTRAPTMAATTTTRRTVVDMLGADYTSDSAFDSLFESDYTRESDYENDYTDDESDYTRLVHS